MIPDDEPRFAVDAKPKVMLNARCLNHRFVRMPFVRIKVKRRQQPDSHIVKQRRKFDAPIADGGMGNLDINGGTQDQADISERVFPRQNMERAVMMKWTG